MTRERRAAYRVSVKPRSGLAASVHVSDRYWKAVPGNISPEGIFLRLEPDAPVELKISANVEVEIVSADETLLLHGVIRSRRAGGYGILFPERSEEGYVNPLEELGHVCAELQREMLSKRLFRGSE